MTHIPLEEIDSTVSDSTQSSSDLDQVGIIGLGTMGSAIARNLIRKGHRVIGFDINQPRCDEMRADNVAIAGSAAEVGASANIVLLSLPSTEALNTTVDALLAATPRHELIVAELSTLSIEDKTANHDRLANAGIVLLDCPLSGTGAQAVTGDLVVYASGDANACERCGTVFAGFARANSYLGAFGNGTRMKFVANLLVAIHNVAAAEAIVLGAHAGLDPAMMCQVLANGAGGSRMLEIRGPAMVSGCYEPVGSPGTELEFAL